MQGMSPAQWETFFREHSLAGLLAQAGKLRDAGHGDRVSYSPKVFIPLTQLCRDVCHYCTFAKSPRELAQPYLGAEEVMAIARAGQQHGCTEALFTLGDKPELRHGAARDWLSAHGFPSTLHYLEAMCSLVLRETSLLPHVNAGVMSADWLSRLRRVSASQGLMLESAAARLCGPGQVHNGSPDKLPSVRLATIEAAGERLVPFTSGVLIGIGETRRERIDSLLALQVLHARYGHLQEIIIQNFRAKPGTKRAQAAEPDLPDLQWTIAAARLIFGPSMNIQAPPNLSFDDYQRLLDAGINDWGGISPVTPDHVNPEAPWPELADLRGRTQAAGRTLVARLPVYPEFVRNRSKWLDAELRTKVLRCSDAEGYARDCDWAPGMAGDPVTPVVAVDRSFPSPDSIRGSTRESIQPVLDKARSGAELTEEEIASLFRQRGTGFEAVCRAADELRRELCGDLVRYVVNRNINYTNVCGYRCRFCAFSKGKLALNLRGAPYNLDLAEVGRRAVEAWRRGATEVCMQGGIHPDYDGNTYISLVHAVKEATPQMHVHAFSPLEISHGARTLGLSVETFLLELRRAGLGSLPGTAAEILDDDVRRVICPDKLTSQDWLSVMRTAHEIGLRTTATIMFGHVEGHEHWARHLLAIRRLQAQSGGFTELVPLPFVHMEAPLHHQGLARLGPTWREALLMHAVARLVLHALVPNIQVSWVKMGHAGAAACLAAGANDLGGTLMNESISRAAGASHGEELAPARMDALIRQCARTPAQRTTTYGVTPDERARSSYQAAELEPVIQTPARKYARATAQA